MCDSPAHPHPSVVLPPGPTDQLLIFPRELFPCVRV